MAINVIIPPTPEKTIAKCPGDSRERANKKTKIPAHAGKIPEKKAY